MSITKESVDYFNNDNLAIEAWNNKYKGSNDLTPDDMHKRMAKKYYEIEEFYNKELDTITWNKLSHYGRHREALTEERIYNYFKNFKYIIPGGSIMASLGTSNLSSLSNCFVIDGPEDDYSSIIDTRKNQANIMKRRGGVGFDISKLRPNGALVNNAAKTSTGPISFMEGFSQTTNEVAQDGRRGALMLSIDINHPDVLDFINSKQDLAKITGANISVKTRKEFMKAVKNDEDYILRWPCDLDITLVDEQLEYNVLTDYSGIGYVKKVKAKDIWTALIKAAWKSAEPGILFWDNILNQDPAGLYSEYQPVSTNPLTPSGILK